MKILVVGGAGYIGSHVVHAFIENGDKVAVLDNFSSGARGNVAQGVEVLEGNILDSSFLNKALSIGWDAVVHLAAFKSVGESMENPAKYARNNISGTINLLNAMLANNSPALVFSSSAAIFGKPLYIPIDENHPKDPQSFYGFTKWEIENILNWYSRLSNFNFASLRYFNAAGYDLQKRVTHLEKDSQNLIPIIMEAASGLREGMNIHGNDYDTADGTCVRDYVHVSDLADAHVSAMNYIVSQRKNIEVNLGSEKGISVIEMVKEVIRLTGIEFSYKVGPRRPGDPDTLIASSQKARNLLGWKAERSDVSTIISSTWDMYKRNN